MAWTPTDSPTCEDGHSAHEMTDEGPVLHGQSRLFRCVICGRRVRLSNAPGEDSPRVRELGGGD